MLFPEAKPQYARLNFGSILYRGQKKYIISGHIIKVLEYERIFHHTEPKKRTHPGQADKEQQEINYKKRMARRRSTVIDLCNCNFDVKYAKFLTLTFAENQTDVKRANTYFKAFIRRMKKEHGTFKYLAVIEFLHRGAVHYHLLCDLPYIPSSCISNTWGHGFIRVNAIEHVDNIGAYVVKYMSKESDDDRLRGEKGYLCSKGLLRPKEIRQWGKDTYTEELQFRIDEAQIMAMIQDREPTYMSSRETEYCGRISYTTYNLKREYNVNGSENQES